MSNTTRTVEAHNAAQANALYEINVAVQDLNRALAQIASEATREMTRIANGQRTFGVSANKLADVSTAQAKYDVVLTMARLAEGITTDQIQAAAVHEYVNVVRTDEV